MSLQSGGLKIKFKEEEYFVKIYELEKDKEFTLGKELHITDEEIQKIALRGIEQVLQTWDNHLKTRTNDTQNQGLEAKDIDGAFFYKNQQDMLFLEPEIPLGSCNEDNIDWQIASSSKDLGILKGSDEIGNTNKNISIDTIGSKNTYQYLKRISNLSSFEKSSSIKTVHNVYEFIESYFSNNIFYKTNNNNSESSSPRDLLDFAIHLAHPSLVCHEEEIEDIDLFPSEDDDGNSVATSYLTARSHPHSDLNSPECFSISQKHNYSDSIYQEICALIESESNIENNQDDHPDVIIQRKFASINEIHKREILKACGIDSQLTS